VVAWRCLPSRHAGLLLTIARHATHTPVEPHSGQTGANVEFWEDCGPAAFERERERSAVQRCSLNRFPPVDKNQDRSSDRSDG